MTDTTHSNAPADGYEHDRAIMEAERNASTERVCATYGFCFDPQGRQRYEAGYFNGWRRALQVAAPQPQAVQAEHADTAQLPVAAKSHGAWDGLETLDSLPDGTELYAHPAAQAVQAQAADDDIARLLKSYRKLCVKVGRGDSFHLARIDKAIERVEAAPALQVGAGDVLDQLRPVEPNALAASIADLERWESESDGGEPLTQSESESVMLVLHELKRLRAARGVAPVPTVAALNAALGAAFPDDPANAIRAQMAVLPLLAAAVQAPAAGQQAGGVREAFEAWYLQRHGADYMPGGNATWANAHKADDWEVWCAALAATPAPEAEQAPVLRQETPAEVFARVLAEADGVRPSQVSPVDAIEFRRDSYGFTQAQMAQVLRMKPSHYSEFINGHRDMPRVAMQRAYAIGVPAVSLLGRAAPEAEPAPVAWQSRFAGDAWAACEKEHHDMVLQDPEEWPGYEVRALALASSAQQPAWCPNCNGTGESTCMEGGGPDAYEVPCTCPHCGGDGGLEAAYRGVLQKLKEEHTKYIQLCGKHYFRPAPEAEQAAPAAVRVPSECELQSAFEDWLTRTLPSGDAEAVQRQWEASTDYAGLLAAPLANQADAAEGGVA